MKWQGAVSVRGHYGLIPQEAENVVGAIPFRSTTNVLVEEWSLISAELVLLELQPS
jgi:hypothetical protein